MAYTPDPFGSDDNPLDASDWSGTETKQLDISRPAQVAATLYRYVNGLDVDIDIAVVGSDDTDSTFAESEDPPR